MRAQRGELRQREGADVGALLGNATQLHARVRHTVLTLALGQHPAEQTQDRIDLFGRANASGRGAAQGQAGAQRRDLGTVEAVDAVAVHGRQDVGVHE